LLGGGRGGGGQGVQETARVHPGEASGPSGGGHAGVRLHGGRRDPQLQQPRQQSQPRQLQQPQPQQPQQPQPQQPSEEVEARPRQPQAARQQQQSLQQQLRHLHRKEQKLGQEPGPSCDLNGGAGLDGWHWQEANKGHYDVPYWAQAKGDMSPQLQETPMRMNLACILPDQRYPAQQAWLPQQTQQYPSQGRSQLPAPGWQQQPGGMARQRSATEEGYNAYRDHGLPRDADGLRRGMPQEQRSGAWEDARTWMPDRPPAQRSGYGVEYGQGLGGGKAAWPRRSRKVAGAPPQSNLPQIMASADTMKAQLQALQLEDPATVFITRRINKLGFSSPEQLQEHFGRFGPVKCVYASHSRVKSVRQATAQRSSQNVAQWRLRAAALGFVVMESPEATERILAEGPEHMVNGVPVRVHAYHRRLSSEMGDMGEKDDELDMEHCNEMGSYGGDDDRFGLSEYAKPDHAYGGDDQEFGVSEYAEPGFACRGSGNSDHDDHCNAPHGDPQVAMMFNQQRMPYYSAQELRNAMPDLYED